MASSPPSSSSRNETAARQSEEAEPFAHPPIPSGHSSSSSSPAPLRIKITKRSRADESDPKAKQQKVSPIASSPLSNGLLNGNAGPSKSPATSHDESAVTSAPVIASPRLDESFQSHYLSSPVTPLSSAHKRKKRQHLKDVLPKLVQSLIRRDAYGFFLAPVDEREVPGYRTVIREPMDLGTMEARVKEGTYGTMDAFKGDFLLLTKNAKLFNPPASIYHIQAQKLEEYGIKAIEKLEEKGIRQEGDISSPEPDVYAPTAHSPYGAAVDIQHQDDMSVDSPSSTQSKRISIKLTKRPSLSSHPEATASKKARKSKKARDASRDQSRPLVSSSLSRPPMLATSPSIASDDDSNDEGVGESDDDREEEEAGTVHSHGNIKTEEFEQDERLPDSTDDESSDAGDENDDTASLNETSRGASMSRSSLTPAPGGSLAAALRRKAPPPRTRNFPPRNAPTPREEAASTLIKKTEETSSKDEGIEIGLNEAALRVRAEMRTRDQPRPLAFLPDGSIDLESQRFAERCDLLAPMGFVVDPATRQVPLALSNSLTIPVISSSHPLHPDAQRFPAQLTRPAPYDALRLATNEAPVPREASGSHYEHVMPPHHHRLPMYLPTSDSGSGDHHGSTSSPQSIPREPLGAVAKSVADVPHRWPHPKRSALAEYEPYIRPDPLYPPYKEAEKPLVQGREAKSRNRDMELFLQGQSQLRDWTFPHIYYSRAWDGATDLAIWKDVEGAIIGSGNAQGPPEHARGGPSPGPGFCLYSPDGNLGPYERWEWSRLELLRNSILWEDNEATCRATGLAGPDRVTEKSMLEKLLAIDSAVVEGTQGQGGGLRHPAIPAHEKASQADSSARFLQNHVWGGFEGELWATSMERFVQGAVASVSSHASEHADEMSSDEEESPAWSRAAAKYTKTQEDKMSGGSTPLTPMGNGATPAVTRQQHLLDASLQDMILDRPLYQWVRDEVIVPASKRQFAAVISRAGEFVEEFEGEADEGRPVVNGQKATLPSPQLREDDVQDLPDTELLAQIERMVSTHRPNALQESVEKLQAGLTTSNISYLISHMPLIWSRLRLIRALLDKPLHLVDIDDLPPFMLDPANEDRKRLEWFESPPRPHPDQMSKVRDQRLHPVRFEDREWTGTRMAQALRQYAHIELELDRRIRVKAERASLEDAKESKEQQVPGQGNGPEEIETEELKEELRLALLALARFAPSTSVLL
ncbi:unnamed protein product [Parajaminaea phylloscopi]